MGYQWKKCLEKIAEEYCQNTTLHGYKYLVQPGRPKIEKLIWLLVIIIALSSAFYVFNIMLYEYEHKSTITAIQNPNYEVRNVPFPGIAICNVNKISRKHALEVAKEIHNNINISVEEIFDAIKWFGSLYDFEVGNSENLHHAQKVIEQYNEELYQYDILFQILERLATPCSEIVIKCFWNGQQSNCEEIFTTRRTMDGLCCTFNYVKQSDKHLKAENVLFPGAGVDLGLTIIVRSQPDDYYYPLTSTEGLSVKIFNPHEYPDVSSGGLAESFVPLEHEVFIQIGAEMVKAAPEVKKVPKEKRGCTFDNEGKTVFDSTFISYSDCLAECKMKSILALCECVPFFFPVMKSFEFGRHICTLSDIICLNKYKGKWMNVFPSIDIDELEYERENSVHCPHCLPSCSFTSYSVATDYAKLIYTTYGLTNGLNLSEHSIIHIYSDSEYASLYETDVPYYWFDVVSNFGGVCGLFIGFSIISMVELFYFFTVRYYRLLVRTYVK